MNEAMKERLRELYLNDEIDEKKLANAVKKEWISENDMNEIIQEKSVE